MSKHFEDARYYLGRAVEHAKEGVKEDLAPVADRGRAIVGKQREPEPSRMEATRTYLTEFGERAEGAIRETVASARETLESYRRKGGNVSE